MKMLNNALRHLKKVKFSGISKLAGASVAVFGSGYKAAKGIDSRGVISLQDIYNDISVSTVFILSSITLIAIGLLADKGLLKDKTEEKTIRDILPLSGSFSLFAQDIPHDVKEIWLCGLTFSSTILKERDRIIDLLENRRMIIKIILCPDKGPAFDQVTKFFPEHLPDDVLRDRLKVSYNYLLKWTQKYKNLEVKTFNVFPSSNLIFINPNDNYKLQVQPFIYNEERNRCPFISLDDNEQKEFFKMYKKGFQDFWLSGDNL